MPKIILSSGNITAFNGGAIVCPCDVELTNKDVNPVIESIFEKTGTDLLTELSIIGYCDLGHAVITKGYKLKVKHLIFLPYIDNSNSENKINHILLHQAFKAVFNLVRLYKIKTLAISPPRIRIQKNNLLEKFMNLISGDKPEAEVKREEMIDIVTAIAKENKDTLGEVIIYR